MGIEARRQVDRDPEKDSLLPTTQNPAAPHSSDAQAAPEEGDDDKYTKRRQRSKPAFKCVIGSTPALALVTILFLLYVGCRDSSHTKAFPWPSPSPLPEPPFIKEGIEQCKIVQRQAGGLEWDKARTDNDRSVPFLARHGCYLVSKRS